MKMNIYDLPQLPLPEELTTVLAQKGGVRLERVISAGHTSGWYDQAESEFVILVEGTAVIEYERGAAVTMQRGDTLLLKPHVRHRISYTSSEPPCLWLCYFY